MNRISSGMVDAAAAIPGQVVGATVGSKLAGQGQKRYMDAAYPGTSAFDRLGGNAGSGAQSSGMSDAVRIADKQTRSAQKVARIQRQGAENVARITSAAPMGRLDMDRTAGTASAAAEANRARASVDRVNADLLKLGMPRARETAKFAKQLAEADVTFAQTRNLVNGFANLMKRSGSVTPEQVGDVVRGIGNMRIDEALELYKLFLNAKDISRLPAFPGTKSK